MAVKHFLDQNGFEYLWTKIINKIANIKPSDIGALTAPATIIADKWLKIDAEGNVILSDPPTAVAIPESVIQSIVDESYSSITES